MILCLEGPDGVGKTTIAGILANKIPRCEYMRCPGTTKLGELLRGPLKDKSFEMSEEVLALAFATADIDVMNKAAKVHAAGGNIVMDRCGISNIAYRMAFDQDIGLEVLERLGVIAIRPPANASSVVIIDIDEFIYMERVKGRDNANDRFETEGISRWRRIRDAYLSPRVARYTDHIVRMNCKWSPEESAHMILKAAWPGLL